MKIKYLAIFLIASIALATGAEAKGSEYAKPNIVLFLADDLGYGDVGCYGAEDIATPNIDRLRAQGMKFTSFYVHNRCSPTRAALMTGCDARRVGLGNVVYWKERMGINPEETTTAELLQKAGYTTGIIGKWHLGEWKDFNPVNHGFDRFYGFMADESTGRTAIYSNKEIVQSGVRKTDGKYTPALLAEGIEFIRDNADKPFFLYYASPLPHRRWMPNERFKGTSEQGTYGDVVQEIDWQVGELMDALKGLGLSEGTLFIFASDNGPQLNVDGHGSPGVLRDGKWTNFEGGIRVPCIMRWLGKIPACSVNSEIAAIYDLLPTFCDIAGVEVPSDRDIDGRSILPYLLDKNLQRPLHDTFVTSSTIRHGDWKLYLKKENPGGKGSRGMQGREPAEKGALFNLEKDVGETTDVSEKHPEKVEQLRRMASQYRKELSENKRSPGYVEGFDAESAKRAQKEMKKQ